MIIGIATAQCFGYGKEAGQWYEVSNAGCGKRINPLRQYLHQ